MKKIILLLVALPFFFLACQDEDSPNIAADLHYDAENFAAPLLDPGTHTAGIFFPASTMESYEGKELEEVLFYLDDLPSACFVHLYKKGLGNFPGESLYSRDVTDELEANSWNFHTLSTPVPLTGEDLWICIRVTHGSIMGTVGCDPGPATNNGDWVNSNADNIWLTLREKTADEVDINWNIRARVSE